MIAVVISREKLNERERKRESARGRSLKRFGLSHHTREKESANTRATRLIATREYRKREREREETDLLGVKARGERKLLPGLGMADASLI